MLQYEVSVLVLDFALLASRSEFSFMGIPVHGRVRQPQFKVCFNFFDVNNEIFKNMFTDKLSLSIKCKTNIKTVFLMQASMENNSAPIVTNA